jgi:hypothetical protein
MGPTHARMLETQRKLINRAKRIQQNKDAHHMAVVNPRVTEFKPGSLVLAEHNEAPRKLAMNLRGPFRVVSHDNNDYQVTNLLSGKDEHIILNNLRPFNYDANFVDPKDVAMHDVTSTFIVEKILAHSGSKLMKSEMDFLVRWLGFGPDKDLWVPWKELRLNPALHDYLRKNRMASIIPKLDDL